MALLDLPHPPDVPAGPPFTDQPLPFGGWAPPDAPPSTPPPVPPPPPSAHGAGDTAGGAPGRQDRSGAIWVTAAGALLLFAAAATFVAVRWDQLHDWQKFAALLVVTQLLLVGGWIGRRRVPATAAATFSLGAVLVPLDAWTVAGSGTGDWRRGLFVGGVLAVVSLPIARRLLDTVALRWAWVAAVPTACAGVAAFVGYVPPAVVVAALGLLALSAGYRRDGAAWLLIGAAAPLATLAGPSLPWGTGVLHDLGLLGPALPWTTAATAVLLVAAVALHGKASGRSDLVAVGTALAVIDLGAALAIGHVSASSWWLTGAAVVLAVELVATFTAGDPFWSKRWLPTAVVAEAVTGLAWLPLVVARFLGDTDLGVRAPIPPITGSLVAGVVAVAWLVADDREGRQRGRRSGRRLLTGADSVVAGWAVAVYLTIAVVSLPIDGIAVRTLLVALAAALLIGRRSAGAATGTIIATIAGLPLGSERADVALLVAALLVVAFGARRQSSTDAAIALSVAGAGGLVLDGGALLADAMRHIDLDGAHWLTPAATLAGGAVAGLALGTVAGSRTRPVVSTFPWAVALGALVALFGIGHPPWLPVLLAAGLTLWWTSTALGRLDVVAGAFAVAASPAITVAVLQWAGYAPPQLGVGLAVTAIALVGVTMALPVPVGRFLLVSAALHIVLGGAFAAVSPGPFGVVVTIAGGLLLALALTERHVVLAYNGAIVTLLGIWQLLFGYEVQAAEAYLLPLAIVLLAAGAHARATLPMSSWIAFTPPVILLGGTAYALRLSGAPGWHGVVAGAVAVTAIAAGSVRRLAGPLFTGSALLAAITISETLTRTAGAPTWIWLAAGGAVLLSAGVTMELRGLGPVESGKRLVELVSERFE